MNDFLAQVGENTAPELEPHKDKTTVGEVDYYHRLTQGSDEWHELRMGMLTASTFSKVLTSTLKIADSDASRTNLYDLAAQRINPVIEPGFSSFDMERGHTEECLAKIVYAEHYGAVKDCGFVINNSLGFPVGFSPDGMVGDDGLVENKSRMNKLQIKTIIEGFDGENIAVPKEFMMQVQVGLWVTKRKWCDFISYSNGLNMFVTRVEPDSAFFEKIEEAAIESERKVTAAIEQFYSALKGAAIRQQPVEYYNHHEDIVT
ncbi:MAG: YqaJ viral recombinase family protein [candidate division Zixibacteria bacterium]|nr:YqaJ viral recombinase family protein [candidate division Zixibacteria bacterium]